MPSCRNAEAQLTVRHEISTTRRMVHTVYDTINMILLN